jgi:prolyl-tRNA synthetase
VIVPIFKGEEQLAQISEVALDIQAKLRAKGISVKFDNDTQNKPGWKFAEYELKGVPVRIAMGPRDLENRSVEIARRDNLPKKFVLLKV